MTTIAVTDTEVAWDSQITRGNLRGATASDKVTVIGSTIYACAGDAGACEHAPFWHADGAKIKQAPSGDFTMLVITKDGFRFYDEDNLMGFNVKIPFAIGSGQDFALTAMRLGKSAREAVEIAAEMDVFTGGEIKSLQIADVLKTGEQACRPLLRRRRISTSRNSNPAT